MLAEPMCMWFTSSSRCRNDASSGLSRSMATPPTAGGGTSLLAPHLTRAAPSPSRFALDAAPGVRSPCGANVEPEDLLEAGVVGVVVGRGAEGNPLGIGDSLAPADQFLAAPRDVVAELRVVGGDRMVDHLGHLEGIGRVGDARRVHLEHAPVVVAVGSGAVGGVDGLGEDGRASDTGLDD